MEGRRSFEERYGFLCSILLVFILFCCTHAQDGMVIKEITGPLGNVNLAPYQQWESAYECLKAPVNCPEEYRLTGHGWVNVTRHDTKNYCKKPPGCAAWTREVLKCIHWVKPDFVFMDHATVNDINHTVNHGCAWGFNGAIIFLPSDASKIFNGNTIAAVSAIATWFFLTYMNV